MTVKEYKETIAKLEDESREFKNLCYEYKKDYDNLKEQYDAREKQYERAHKEYYIHKEKISKMIERLAIQDKNEYCDFAIMILNILLGG